MRKVAFFILMLILTYTLFAQPAWNPWCRQWVFEFEEGARNFSFDREHNARDLDTGKTYYYVWTSDRRLCIADFYSEGRHLWMKADFGDDESSCSLTFYDVDYVNDTQSLTDETVQAWAIY